VITKNNGFSNSSMLFDNTVENHNYEEYITNFSSITGLEKLSLKDTQPSTVLE